MWNQPVCFLDRFYYLFSGNNCTNRTVPSAKSFAHENKIRRLPEYKARFNESFKKKFTKVGFQKKDDELFAKRLKKMPELKKITPGLKFDELTDD